MDVRATLASLLDATAAKAAVEARIGVLRDRLDVEARRRWTEEGAAPTWKAAGLGSAAWEGADAPAKPHVRDAAAFAGWLAQQRPAEVVATIAVEADALAEALDALRFAGVAASATVEARPAYLAAYLPTLALDLAEEGAELTAVDPATGEVVPGLGATRGAPRLVVRLDRERKAAAVAEAMDAAEAEDEAPPAAPPKLAVAAYPLSAGEQQRANRDAMGAAMRAAGAA